MTLTGDLLRSYLGSVRWPVKVKHGQTRFVVAEMDREMVEDLIERGAIEAHLMRRGKVGNFSLTQPLSALRLSVKKCRIPVSSACMTTFRQPLGNGKFTYSHKKDVCESYSPENRRAYT